MLAVIAQLTLYLGSAYLSAALLHYTYRACEEVCNDYRAARSAHRNRKPPVMKRGEDPETWNVYPVCDEACANDAGLTWVSVPDETVFPRSCSHCYNCGFRVDGGPGTWCVIDLKPGREAGVDCPDYDYTATRLYRQAALIVGEICLIPDLVWGALHHLTRKHPTMEPEYLANWVLTSPKLFE